MELLCPAAAQAQTGDVDNLCVFPSPSENMLSVFKQTATQTLSDLSESTEPSPNGSQTLSQEQGGHSGSVKHPTCSNMSEGTDSTHSDRSASLEPHILPCFATDSSLVCDFLSSETDAENDSVFLTCSAQPSGDLSWTSQTLTNSSVTDSLSTSGPCQGTCPFRSLSHQSDSLESYDTASAPESDLYIFESEMYDFILGPMSDPQEIKSSDCAPLKPTEQEQADHDYERHDSPELLSKYYQSSSKDPDQALVDYESYVSQGSGLRPSAVDASEGELMSVNDVTVEEEEVTPQAQRNDSPNELWLDACQFLTDGDVSEKTGHSVMQEQPATTAITAAHSFYSLEETPESSYSDTIGWSGDDSGRWGPPVERWSSVDSWATALSDWAEIIAAPLEDISAAFTEIGAEIDALTQALAEVTTHTEDEGQTQSPMGVQDHPLEAEKIAESSIFSGQSCLSFCHLGAELPDRLGSQKIQSLCDCTQQQPEVIQQRACQRSPMGSSGAEVASSGSVETTESTLSEELGETKENFFYFGYDESTMIDNDVILNITEDTDLEEKPAPTELEIKEPTRNRVCEVEDEHIFYPLDFLAKQKSGKSLGSAEILETDRQGAKPSPVVYFHSTRSHVDNHTSLNVHTETHVLHNSLPDLDGACQVEPQWGSPKFIMPLAPLSVGSSFTRQTSSSLKGKNQTCARELSRNLWPNSDGITACLSVEADDDLTHKKERTVDSAEKSCFFTDRKTSTEEIDDLSGDLSHFDPVEHFVICKEKHVACITLDLYDPFGSNAAKSSLLPEKIELKTTEKMPHKTHKTTSECKTRSKKDRSAGHHHHHHHHYHGAQVPKKQENVSNQTQQICKAQESLPGENCPRQDTVHGREDKEVQLVIDSGVGAEKGSNKPHGKKKKKHSQTVAAVKGVVTEEPLGEVENGTMPQSTKGRIDAFEAKLGTNTGKAVKDSNLPDSRDKKSQKSEGKEEKPLPYAEHKEEPLKSALSDDVIKRRRLSQDKFGKIVSALESKLPKTDAGIQGKGAEAKTDVGVTRRKAYSEVVKQKPVIPKEDPKVVQPIQAVSVSGDPQSLCLWCQFAAVFTDYTVTWSREGTTLMETKRSAGDESRVSLTISNASNKHLGKYQCRLSSSHGSVLLDYLLTYEVLSEIVIPSTPKIISSVPEEVASEEEDIRCSRLMFKEDFLSEQYFGENHPASIITEKVHFGEGMHRRAFRTKLQAGQIPLLLPGHSCVLKVHNAITYGTKNNDELIQKNFNLAVEECQVQNTAREYIKAYDAAAQSLEAFGEVPDIIPIYLVHRPSSDIPYATLEEELIGDFVKYSVKDGKEINLMRRDSEAGQKCCAFQHWVYHQTEGNLLVTDMQGVGMKLTDVGIATCKKGYKGFRGNCATSFIDQFKALHQCNMYCEILGLKSLQPKPKKPAPKPKAQPSAAAKNKLFGPTVKGKS